MARILVIDDNDLVRATLWSILEWAGHQVVEARDGDAGLAAYRREPCDLVFCDLFMPGRGGLATIRKLCADFPGVKVVAMTGSSFDGGPDVLPAAERAGAVGSLPKPFNQETVLAALDEALRTPSCRGPVGTFAREGPA
jgi:CheY-like chemotaxis protein